ncbi:MAG: ribosome-associated translation inhibitor RaiA [Gammaproteobacteria bacterium]|nr:ribosome-associated translation inhibitor RaiA [Gammaproteobacteria bacterium]
MQINISGHHVDLTEALKTYINEKLEKLSRHLDKITSINVTLNIDSKDHLAEATVRFRGGEIFAEASANDMYAAIDGLSDKLDRQILKHKEKQVARNHGAAR